MHSLASVCGAQGLPPYFAATKTRSRVIEPAVPHECEHVV